jgi:hypothetical protein
MMANSAVRSGSDRTGRRRFSTIAVNFRRSDFATEQNNSPPATVAGGFVFAG